MTRKHTVPISRRAMLRRSISTIAVGGAIVLGGCGSTRDAKKTVDMIEMTYDPADLTVTVGTTVTWENTSTFIHTVTADPSLLQDPTLASAPDGQTFDSGNIGSGESWSYTFNTPGEYRYACIPHEMAGMVGRVMVNEENANN